MTQSVQVCTRIALYGKNESHGDLTIEDMAKVARDILGDNYRSYAAEAALVNAGLNLASGSGSSSGYSRKKQRMNNGTSTPVTSSRDPRIRDKTFCKKHGWNKTHSTQACFSTKEKEKETSYGLNNRFLVKKTNLNLHRMKKRIVYIVKNLGVLGTSARNTLNRKRTCQFFLSKLIVINSLQMRELTTRKMNLPHLQRMMRMI